MPSRPTNIRVDSEILAALQAIKARESLSVNRQLKLALLDWIESRGVTLKVEKPAEWDFDE